MEDTYKKAISEAIDLVKDVPVDFRKSAFEVILGKLLESSKSSLSNTPAFTQISKEKIEKNNSSANIAGLTQEELDILFENRDGVLFLKVKPAGKDLAEQQQMLAHILLVGYRILLGKESATSFSLGAAAREWDILDSEFSRKVKKSIHIQSRGKRAGVKYSLKPGAISKLKESIQKMAHGE